MLSNSGMYKPTMILLCCSLVYQFFSFSLRAMDYMQLFLHHTPHIFHNLHSFIQDGTIKTVNDLLTKYPRLTSKVVLNYPTVEQELRLYALVITNKQSNNRQKGKLLTVSSIHAREIATGEMSEYTIVPLFFSVGWHAV